MCDIAIGDNINNSCNIYNGGIAKFYPFKYVKNAFTVVDGIATAKSDDLSVAFEYNLRRNGANTFNDVSNGNPKIGNLLVDQTFVAELIGIEGTANFELTKLQQSNHSGVFQDENDVYHWIGHENGFNETTSVDAAIESSLDGFNGYRVTLVSKNKTKAPVLNEAARDAFLAIVTE